MIPKKEVQKVAKLARLGLTNKEITKYQKDISKILDYIEKLKEVDISGMEPMSHSILVENVVRKDVSQEAKETKLMQLAPEIKGGYLKVKSILK